MVKILRALPKITPPSRLQIFPISDFSSVKNLSLQLLLHLKIFSVRKNRILEKFETESREVIFGRALIEKDKKLYQCEECGFHYEDKEWAEKCGAWCREHKSCNIEIMAHAEENKSAQEPLQRTG